MTDDERAGSCGSSFAQAVTGRCQNALSVGEGQASKTTRHKPTPFPTYNQNAPARSNQDPVGPPTPRTAAAGDLTRKPVEVLTVRLPPQLKHALVIPPAQPGAVPVLRLVAQLEPHQRSGLTPQVLGCVAGHPARQGEVVAAEGEADDEAGAPQVGHPLHAVPLGL